MIGNTLSQAYLFLSTLSMRVQDPALCTDTVRHGSSSDRALPASPSLSVSCSLPLCPSKVTSGSLLG